MSVAYCSGVADRYCRIEARTSAKLVPPVFEVGEAVGDGDVDDAGRGADVAVGVGGAVIGPPAKADLVRNVLATDCRNGTTLVLGVPVSAARDETRVASDELTPTGNWVALGGSDVASRADLPRSRKSFVGGLERTV
jgi:hypothetical protein